VSDADTLTDVLPTGTTFVSFTNTITLTVHVNAVSGTTLKNTASVAAKTQDVFPSNNSSTTYVKVQYTRTTVGRRVLRPFPRLLAGHAVPRPRERV